VLLRSQSGPTSILSVIDTLSSPSPTNDSHVSPSEPTSTPTSQNGNEGGSNAGDMTPTFPALLLCSSLDENRFQSYEEKVPFMKYRV